MRVFPIKSARKVQNFSFLSRFRPCGINYNLKTGVSYQGNYIDFPSQDFKERRKEIEEKRRELQIQFHIVEESSVECD